MPLFSGWNISHRIGFDIFREIVVPRHQFPGTIPQPFAPFWPNTIQVFTFQSWGFSRIEQLIARKSDFVWKGKQFLPLLSSRLFFIFEAKIYVSTAFLKPSLLGITNNFVDGYTIYNTYLYDIFIIIWRKISFKKCAVFRVVICHHQSWRIFFITCILLSWIIYLIMIHSFFY